MERKNLNRNQHLKVYCKGVLAADADKDSKVGLAAAVGVAICNDQEYVVFEAKNSMVVGEETSKRGIQAQALAAGLMAVLDLGLRWFTCFCDDRKLYQSMKGTRQPKKSNTRSLVSQLTLLQSKFVYFKLTLVAPKDIKFASELAFDALNSQIKWNGTCLICFESIDISKMFSIDSCLHKYCFCCMKKHVEVKLLHGIVVKCPHEGCKSEIKFESYGKLLEPELIVLVRERIGEAKIPVSARVYCPYPRCSALMSKSVILEFKITPGATNFGAMKCTKCRLWFCINCRVAWHKEMTCDEYKRSASYLLAEEGKVNSLAKEKLWRQCVQCNHMVELAQGCYHITCRCGYEFCYHCGCQYNQKKATCSCPLWDERFLLRGYIAP